MFSKQHAVRNVMTVAAILAATYAQADTVVFGTSNANNLESTINLLPIAPINEVSGVAPGAYNFDSTVLPLAVNVSPTATLTTGVLNSKASSDVDGSAGNKTASASTLTDGLNLEVGNVIVILGDILALSAQVIESTATVTGQGGSFMASGASSIAGLNFDTSLTSPLVVGAFDDPVANTVLFSALGISIILNEQFGTCDAVFCELTVNAIAVRFDDTLLGLGAALGLEGDLIIGHSYAALSAAPIPEASTYGMMLAGLGLVGFMARRRTQR